MQASFSAQQIASVLNGSIEGDPNVQVNNFSKIEEGRPGTITFLANPKYTHYIYTTEASIVLVNSDFVPEQPVNSTMIRVSNAYSALAVLLDMVEKSKPVRVGVETLAYVADSVTLGKDVYVGGFAYIDEDAKIGQKVRVYPHVYIGENVEIGENTTIYAGAKIYAGVKIGKNCIIHAGAVIGSDGFGFAPDEDGFYQKIPQMGSVIIEDYVEVGANTTIDRAVMDATIVRRGVKLDNLIQVAHNVEIGENTVMASQVGISGSTKVGKNCMFGGQVGLGGHITVGDNSNIGAQSGIISNVPEGSKIIGAPAIPVKNFFRSSVVFPKLPDMYRQMNQMQKELDELKKKLG